MNIQANINQLLSIAAIAAKLDPKQASRAQLYSTKQELAKSQKESDLIEESEKQRPLTEAEKELKRKLGEKVATSSEKIFELNPNLKTYEQYIASRTQADEFSSALQKEHQGKESIQRKSSIKQQLRERADAEREFAEQTRRDELRATLLNWRD